ncbi:sodium:proton exchanger [Alkaliphilus transvaalensis]|nr:sodium:proton exchanger [Alkaliphilus sp. AH-315-G20]MBN4067795.1 sodium:proton exchanger [Alkaliphilus transvaalensis]
MDSYGFLSLIPPLLAVIIAFVYKNVILALFIAVLSGAFILAGGNPYETTIVFFQGIIFEELKGSFNSQMLLMMALIGGFVALIEKSGGAFAFAKAATKVVNTRMKAQLLLWLCGLGIFFTDSGNSLILGPTFKPITDKLRISREKVSYILDSTSSPICILIPFIGWGIFIMSLIQKEYEHLGIAGSEFTAFLRAIPFQLYAISALLLVPIIALIRTEFGPMAKAEHRAYYENKMLADGAEPLRPDTKIEIPEGVEPKASSIVIPLIVLFVTMFTMFVTFGFPGRMAGPDMRVSILTAYVLSTCTCMFLVVRNKVMNFKEAIDTVISGMQRMMYILIVLVLAWSIGSVSKTLGTSVFIVDLAEGLILPSLVPALIFVIGCIIAFTTGTSWGTFAILMPIAIPMAHAFDISIYAAIGAVLSGGLFGDHCSPISDTTILASMGASSDHIDHVKTQIPYAATAGFASFIGFIVAGFTGSPLTIIFTVVLMVGLLLTFSKIWGERLPNVNYEDLNKANIKS